MIVKFVDRLVLYLYNLHTITICRSVSPLSLCVDVAPLLKQYRERI